MNKMRIGKLIYILAILTGNLAAAASGQDVALFSFSQSPVHSEGNYFEDLFDFDDPYNDEVYDYEQGFFGGLIRQEESNNQVSGDNIYGSESENLDASRDRGSEICFVENLFGTEGLPTSIPIMDALQSLESTSQDDGEVSQELFVSTRREKRGRGGEKRFKCTHEGCSYAAKQNAHLIRHMLTHTEERSYACTHDGCSYTAKSKSTLKDHMRTHTGERTYACTHDGCSYVVKRKVHLIGHMLMHTGERSYACTHDGCSYATRVKSHLSRHMGMHTGERPYACTHEGCSYATADKTNLKAHMRRKHTEERPYACMHDGCLYAAKSKHVLTSHMMRRHNKEGVQEEGLPGCENGMPTSIPIIAALQTQIEIPSNSSVMTLGEPVDNNQPTEEGSPRSLVAGDENYDFNFDERSDFFGDTTGFSLEENQTDVFDTEAQSVACTGSSSLSSWNNSENDVSSADKTGEPENYLLNENEEVSAVQRLENDNEGIAPGGSIVNIQRKKRGREGERRFKCTHEGCSYAAKNNADLIRHMRTHTGERPYACTHEGCSYAAKQKAHLIDHMRTHTGERQYACTHEGCSYVAKQKAHLIVHMRKHTEEKPYPCTYEGCSYASSKVSNLSRHMRTQHTGERPYACTYEGCSYAAKSKQGLHVHIMREHNQDEAQKRSLSARENGMPTSIPIIAALQTQIGIPSNNSVMILGEPVDNNQLTEEESARSLVRDDSNSENDLSCDGITNEAENHSFDENEEGSVVQRSENDNDGIELGESFGCIQRIKRARGGEQRFEYTQGCSQDSVNKSALERPTHEGGYYTAAQKAFARLYQRHLN